MNGRVSDSMLVNTALMVVYVSKFFLWEAGYWNTMDIAHDRGVQTASCCSLYRKVKIHKCPSCIHSYCVIRTLISTLKLSGKV